MYAEKLPPHDADAEEAVIGSLLIDGEVINRIAPLVRVDDFYRDYAVSKPLLNLRNAVQTALLVVYAAYHNTRSVGCHYRDDSHDGR